MTLVLWYGGRLVLSGDMDPGLLKNHSLCMIECVLLMRFSKCMVELHG